MEPVRLTLLQLDVAASFDLCDPAVVNGPRGLWNRCNLGLAPLPQPHHGLDPTGKSQRQGVTPTPVILERLSWAPRVSVTSSQGEAPGAPNAQLQKSKSRKGLAVSLDPAEGILGLTPSFLTLVCGRWGPIPGGHCPHL